MPNSTVKVKRKHITTGAIDHFDSITAASIASNVPIPTIRRRLQVSDKYYKDNYLFKVTDEPWTPLLKVKMYKKPVISTNLTTNEVIKHFSIMHASISTGVNTTSISNCCKSNTKQNCKNFKFTFVNNLDRSLTTVM